MSGQGWRLMWVTTDRREQEEIESGGRPREGPTSARDLSRHPTSTRYLACAERHGTAGRTLVAATAGGHASSPRSVRDAGSVRAGAGGDAQPDAAPDPFG